MWGLNNEKMRNSFRHTTWLVAIAILLVAGDLAYSFYQHSKYPMDGDMEESILPRDYLIPLYQDPFGVKMLAHHEPHAAPNRFFSHYLLYKTYRTVPFALQKVVEPLQSVYLTNAICKTLMQIALLLLLCVLVCGGFRVKEPRFYLAMLLFTPLFQTNGATRSFGMIDPSLTYSFFYALPLIFLICCLLPFIYEEFFHRPFLPNPVLRAVWFLFFLILTCFSGGVNTAIAIVAILTLAVRYIFTYSSDKTLEKKSLGLFFRSIPKHYWLYLLPLGLLSLYALWLGTFNTMWSGEIPTLAERYRLLPKGFLSMFKNTAFDIFFALSVLNFVIIRLKFPQKGHAAVQFFLWMNVFALLYMALLPFGGYRSYRPGIIRYDVIIAVNFLYILFLVYSTLFLLENLSKQKVRISYIIGCLVFMAYFTAIDKPLRWGSGNEKEIAAIRQIQAATETPVVLTEPATVVSWMPAYSVEESKNASEMLYVWRITDTVKPFYCLNVE